MDAMTYEGFLRKVFGIPTGNMLDRSGDPASLANTDVFELEPLEKIKAAVAYGISIANHNLIETNHDLNDSDYTALSNYVINTINANSKLAVIDIIRSYRTNYLDVYFN